MSIRNNPSAQRTVTVMRRERRRRLLRRIRSHIKWRAALLVYACAVTLFAFIPRPMHLPEPGVPVNAWTAKGHVYIAVADSNGKFRDAWSGEAIQQVVRWREP